MDFMSFFDPFLTINGLAALLTLSVLEIVLGIDNLVFISVLTSRLPAKDAKLARGIGLGLAFLFRIILLAFLTVLIGLTQPVVSAFGVDFSWRDFILIGGGLFLLAKGTWEIHENVEAPKATGGELPGGEKAKGPLMFQGDHGIVAYRNVKWKALDAK